MTEGSGIQVGPQTRTAEEAGVPCFSFLPSAGIIAVLDHLFPDGGGLIVLDDPLNDMDTDRIERSCRLIVESAKRHQIIFLTCREDYAELLGGNVIHI